MSIKDIYYYFIAFAMIAGVLIANLLNLDIDQKPDGGICVRFGSSKFLYSKEVNDKNES